MERALGEGVQFANLDQLKQACREFAIQNAFEFKTLRSSKTRYEIACKATGCRRPIPSMHTGAAIFMQSFIQQRRFCATFAIYR